MELNPRKERQKEMAMKIKASYFTFWKVVGYIILFFGAIATFQRFYYGLGYTTNMSDNFPWGFWVGFDILVGIGVAAGGFTITAMVYIFNMKKYKVLIKPVLLTALMGYAFEGVALMYDLGKYFNIWRPLVYGNYRSPMFVLAVCVVLFTGVLALEFFGFTLSKFEQFKKPVSFIKSIFIVLVIVGVIISVVHQSTLGLVFTIVPEKLHPLWYSKLLPLYFFLTSVGVAFGMTIVESYLSWRALGHEVPLNILANLARGMIVVHLTYFVAYIEDLFIHGKLKYLVDGSFYSFMWWLENIVWLAIPLVIVANRKWLATRVGVFTAGFAYVFGFVLNRFNVAMTAMEYSLHANYMPTWQEVVVSASFIVVMFYIYGYAVKHLGLFDESHGGEGEEPELVL